jgi:branched-chain amino acid transport system substrate-binding protein
MRKEQKTMRRRHAIGVILALVVIAAVWLVVALKDGPPQTDGQQLRRVDPVAQTTVKVGFQTPLTGPIAKLGEDRKAAVAIAVRQFNESRASGGTKLEILYEDNKGEPKTGVTIVQKWLSMEGLKYLMVDLTPVVDSVVPLADEAQVVMFAGSAQADITGRSRWVFRIFQSGWQEAEVLSKYLRDAGVAKVYVLHSNELYGNSTHDRFAARFKELGGEVVGAESYSLQATEYRSQLEKARSASPDRVLLLGYGMEYPAILKQAKEAGIATNTIVANLGGANQTVTQLAPEFTEGLVFLGPAFTYRLSQMDDFPAMQDFVTAFEAETGRRPDFRAAYAYDAAMVLALAIEKGQEDPERVRAAILETKDYQGACGRLSFRSDGDAETEVILARYENGRIVPLATP